MADYEYITESGVIVPDTEEILAGVQDEFRAAFGSDLVVTADTPQGVLIAAETLARKEVVTNNAAMANQINPNVAGGIFLDAIMALTGIERVAATKSVISDVTLTGVAGTLIPAGSQAQTTTGDVFALLSGVVLDGTGNGTGDFASDEYGAIEAAVGTLTQIISPVLGWETVTNDNAAEVGKSTQSDVEARAFRKNTLAWQGVSLCEAITSALYYVDGVSSLSFRENYNNVPMGAIISVTGGDTLSGTVWAMETEGTITLGTDGISFISSLQDVFPSPNPWPVAAYTTTGNITLSGLGTQTGGDWSSSLTDGDRILVKNQTSESENAVWVASSSSWTRHSYFTAGEDILGSNTGISLRANSIYVCVHGGSDLDISSVLLENKSGGCAYNGNESVDIVEPVSGQQYTVRFDRATEVPVRVRVTIRAGEGDDDQIRAAILSYAAGEIEGEKGFEVGRDISPFEIAGAISRLYPATYMTKVEVSRESPLSYDTAVVEMALNEVATITTYGISVVNE